MCPGSSLSPPPTGWSYRGPESAGRPPPPPGSTGGGMMGQGGHCVAQLVAHSPVPRLPSGVGSNPFLGCS